MVAHDSHPIVPMDLVLAKELEIIGSHGMPAHAYPSMVQMIQSEKLKPQQLVQNRVSLGDSINILTNMNRFQEIGVTVIDRF